MKREQEVRLWYQKPAENWEQALPVGNGRLGGMVYGRVAQELIALNEDTVWYGGPRDRNNPDAAKHLPEIRRLLMEGQVQEAQHLAKMALTSIPKYFGPYQPLGDLNLTFAHHRGEVKDYERELNLDTAVVAVKYSINGVKYKREIFCSAVDQAMVVRLTCDRPYGITVSANLSRRPFDGGTVTLDDRTIAMNGQCGPDGVQFSALLSASAEDGQIRVVGDFISVERASAATFVLSAGTTFRYGNPQEECALIAAKALAKPVDELIAAHQTDHQSLFCRMSLQLAGPGDEDAAVLPTDERLKRMQAGYEDQGLLALYFQYGRYLLLGSSRPGSLAANLQGIWNANYTPPWESKYTININIQMNYWPAEVCNLAECHAPLFDLISHLRESGRRTAKQVYGARGFVAHHNTGLWGDTAIDGIIIKSSIWPMGAAWLSLHLWEHYRYGGDRQFLAEQGYPIMKEAAQFFLDYLTEDEQGRLLTGPSLSPENEFVTGEGETGFLCMGPSMDSQILHQLFTACIEASAELETDGDLRGQLTAALEKVPQPQIGKYGQIMEWLEDYEEAEPGHRHISQLFALHPGEQITERTPDWFQAARQTIERRLSHGGGHTGWSRAWIINMWARLQDGEEAYQHLLALLRKSTHINLLDDHPPFQIDGNFGGTAGIAEMLLQSHGGAIHLLPALPKAWEEGEITGLRARGGIGVDMSWKDGKLVSVALTPTLSGPCTIRTKQELLCEDLSVETYVERGDFHLRFQAFAGQSYLFRRASE